jgi:acyl-CoA synthetase (NDP forming)
VTGVQTCALPISEKYADWIERHAGHAPTRYRGLQGEALQSAIARDIRGVLMAQYMPPDSEAFGNELIVGIRRTREFGMIINAGIGGTDTELFAERFRKDQAGVAASTTMTDGRTFFELFKSTITYKKMAGLTRGQRRIVTDEQLVECFSSFIAMANFYSADNPATPYVIEELEINPFAFTDFLMVPLDGMCRFSRSKAAICPRPVHKIENLLHPGTIGLVGASASRMNFGRIILKNIVANGFDPSKVVVIRPGAERIDGLRCVPDLASVGGKLDLLILAVDASKVPDLVDEVIRRDAAQAVILIPGGIGETEGSRDRAEELTRKIRQAHQAADGGPVFLGSNCLGVISHPGRYDTLFIPDEKLPKHPGARSRQAAFVSQSGAFMITRLSKRPVLDPAYMIAVGNQTDLTLGDMLTFLKDHKGLTTVAVYAEGFKDLDGLAFVRSVRQAVLNGMDVVFYKAGRTPEGKTATSGHTASLAGDYTVCESCVRQAGAIMAQTFTQFENIFMLSERLHGKKIRGNRLAAVSGAGFEAVGMADRIQCDDYTMQMASFSAESRVAITAVLKESGLDRLVDVKNPLDINPGADDRVHARIVEILSKDPNVDAVVVGLDPLSPATQTLDGDRPYSIKSENSIARLLPAIVARSDKPIIGLVDAGSLYDPLVEVLEKEGLPLFRSSDLAVAAMARYIEGRLAVERIRLREGLGG